jgi:hypothetical protein
MNAVRNEVVGFVRAEGRKIRNGEGHELLLRGVGLGSWLLPEGYMWRMPVQGDRPRRIERMVEDLVGREKAEQFWEIYYDRYTSEEDIRQIAAEGFNSVRVPINARMLIEDREPVTFRAGRIELIDRVIAWCRSYGLYVILDLHGAPGGQTGANIDDSEHDQPELFIHEHYRRMTIELWRMLAERYKDEWIVAGYDLLNEPLPDYFAQYNHLVMPLYKDIVAAIRDVDSKHMIILEGVHWSTDWSIFGEKIDDNVMLQFHKYWNNPDTESIQKYLDMREAWDVPIFMGEGGENNKEWYTGAFRLFEDHDISWNFWTWKKMDTTNSPCSVMKPAGWELLVQYLEGGDQPDLATAEKILWTYLAHIDFHACEYHPEIVNALLRKAPVRIPSIFYGYRGEDVSFGVKAKVEQHIGFRIQDGVKMFFVEGERDKANFQHGGGHRWHDDERICVELAPGDWLAYEFMIVPEESKALYELTLLLSSPHGEGKLLVTLDDQQSVSLDGIGEAWETIVVEPMVSMEQGMHTIVVQAQHHPVRLEWLDIQPVQA